MSLHFQTMKVLRYNDYVDSSRRFIQITDLEIAVLGRWRHAVWWKIIKYS